MTKEEVINAVLENPTQMLQDGKIFFYGGFNEGNCRLEIRDDGWYLCGRVTYPVNEEFVKNIIAENWQKLIKLYQPFPVIKNKLLKDFDHNNAKGLTDFDQKKLTKAIESGKKLKVNQYGDVYDENFKKVAEIVI